jgi:hypothetical protein
MRVRDRLNVSERRQVQVTRAMEVGLVVVLLAGLYRRNIGIVLNSAIALAVTFFPATLERDYDIPMDAGLSLWITSAVFLHALGTLGPYQSGMTVMGIAWSNMTHTLSSSLVAAIGYATTRAIDEHTEDVYFPPQFTFVFILVFDIVGGVLVALWGTAYLSDVVGALTDRLDGSGPRVD